MHTFLTDQTIPWVQKSIGGAFAPQVTPMLFIIYHHVSRRVEYVDA
jgi:hypothetical protein